MLRIYFMATYRDITPTGYELFMYKIRNGQSIPIVVFDLDFAIQRGDSIHFNTRSSYWFNNMFSNDYPIYYWYYRGKKQALPYIYLEVFQDDFFFITVTALSDNKYNILCGFHDKDPSKPLISSQVSNSLDNLNDAVIGIVPVGVRDSTGTYYSASADRWTTLYNFGSPNANIIGTPESGTKKGIVAANTHFSLDSINYFTISSSVDVVKRFRELIGKSKIYNPNDPYPNAGDSPDEPPDGDFDYTPDPIDIPDLPTTSVTDSGLVSLYAPTEAQLKALASFLWSDAFSLDTFKKMFNNPMDCILGLTILPINVPHGSAKEITVGNIVSTVSCDTLPTQYTSLDCGTFEFKQSAFTGSYLDFSPYTKCYVYLPFIGCQEIDIDEFMGSTMGVVYHIDILTGALFCYVTRNDSVIYTYAGCCAENVPLSSNDFSTTVGSIMQIGIAAAGAVATIASAGAATPATAAAATALQAKTAAGVTAAGITGASAVMNSKPSVAHSGSLGGGGGMMGVMYPYLIFIAPRASIPSDQNKYTGFPANKIVKISSLSGFNVIEAVNLEVKGANDSEMSEIDQYLKAGVII